MGCFLIQNSFTEVKYSAQKKTHCLGNRKPFYMAMFNIFYLLHFVVPFFAPLIIHELTNRHVI